MTGTIDPVALAETWMADENAHRAAEVARARLVADLHRQARDGSRPFVERLQLRRKTDDLDRIGRSECRNFHAAQRVIADELRKGGYL